MNNAQPNRPQGDTPDSEGPHTNKSAEQSAHRLLILASVFVIGACGLMYELIAGALASYLLGDSVTQYSLVIGAFLAAMGLGSYLTQWIRADLLSAFLRIQLAVGIVGGFSGLVMFATFAWTDLMTPVVLTITGAVGMLVGMEIPLVIRLLRDGITLRVNIAQVLTLDYLGALAASVAFPFLVLPLLGLTRAAFAFGLLNVLVATFGTAMFWDRLSRRTSLCLWSAVCWSLLLTGLIASRQATSWLEDRLYQDEIIFAETTPYQRIVITRWKEDIRLFLGGHLQFSAADEYRYHEALVVPALAAALSTHSSSDQPLRILMLGGGDGIAARKVLEFPEIGRIDLVDIDRRVVELFRERPMLSALNNGSLSDPRVHVHFEDAFVFLRHDTGPRYDVIIMDLPDPSGVNTNKLYTQTFYGLALRRLKPHGVLVTQASSPFYARRAFWCVAHTLESAIAELPGNRSRSTSSPPADPLRSVFPYHVQVPSFGDWGFLLVTNTPPPRTTWPPAAALQFLTYPVFDRARVFAPDSGRLETEINELDDPVLVRYHLQGWSKWNE